MGISVDVIIPTYKPDEGTVRLIDRLLRQTCKPEHIIIMNTDEEAWNELHIEDRLVDIGAMPYCEIHHIDKKEFNHGHTRNMGVGFSNSKYFICMTQDALPRDDKLISELIGPMSEDDTIKLTYARQLPKKDAGYIERFTRYYNYPAESMVKSIADRDRLGIKIYFASNVCAAFDRETFDKLGHFPDDVILNEDMIYASKVIEAGYKIKYCSSACVYHSHEYTGAEQFHRNFDIAASQVMNKDVFGRFKSESEGVRLVKRNARYLIKEHRAYLLPKLVWMSGCKYLGYKAGRHYRIWPAPILRWMAMNKNFWENYDA